MNGPMCVRILLESGLTDLTDFFFFNSKPKQGGYESFLRFGRNSLERAKLKNLHFMFKITTVKVVYFIYKTFDVLYINLNSF
jgi:hypothetical protein